MLTFYFTPGASSMAPHIALHEVGAAFESHPIVLGMDNLASAYRALNPEGKVPTLMIDDRPLTEVAGILFYLGRAYPQAGLWPLDDIDAQAQVISWMSFIASTIHPARRIGLDRSREVFGIAERRLGVGGWAIDTYSIADIHLFRLFWRFVGAFHPSSGSFPRLEAHYDRMMARPAVQRTCAIEEEIGYALP